jgi:isocitrate dehydrogenase
VIPRIPRLVPSWKKPIIIGRHAFGDQYRAKDTIITGPGKLEMVFKPKDGGQPQVIEVYNYEQTDGGVAITMYNTAESIRGFAHASFKLALERKFPLVRKTFRDYFPKFPPRLYGFCREIMNRLIQKHVTRILTLLSS